MAFTPLENLKNFAQSRPPAVVFIVCLALMATAMISLTSYIDSTDIRSPDYEQDWNTFLGHVSDLEFCVRGNDSSEVAWTGTPTATPSQSTSAVSQSNSYTHLRNYSLPLVLTIQPTPAFVHIPHNITHLQGQIHGYQLGLKDDLYEEAINITFELPFEWNNTDCSGDKCQPVKIVTCVHFIAQANMFPPNNVREPEQCLQSNETGVDYYSYMEGYRKKTMAKHFVCKYKPKIKVQYHWDPTLTIYLTMRDKSLINQHLMHTSTFLFVMVIIMLTYALIKGRPKTRIIEKLPSVA